MLCSLLNIVGEGGRGYCYAEPYGYDERRCKRYMGKYTEDGRVVLERVTVICGSGKCHERHHDRHHDDDDDRELLCSALSSKWAVRHNVGCYGQERFHA